MVPKPAETYSMPSAASASARKSRYVVTPSEGCATSTLGVPPKYAMWVKSRMGSKPTFLFIAGPSTCVGMPDTSKVSRRAPPAPPPRCRRARRRRRGSRRRIACRRPQSAPRREAAPSCRPRRRPRTAPRRAPAYSAIRQQERRRTARRRRWRWRRPRRARGHGSWDSPNPSVSLFLFRLIENVQHPLRVRHGHRRRDVFELERLFQRHIEAFHLGELQGLLGKEIFARLLRQRARHFGDLGVIVDGLGIGIGPVDRAAQGFDEAYEGIAPLLERIGVGDVHANGLLRERRHIAAARDV